MVSELTSNKTFDITGPQEGVNYVECQNATHPSNIKLNKTNWIFSILITWFIEIVFGLKIKQYSDYAFCGQSKFSIYVYNVVYQLKLL